jgi:hypothetical protein
MCGRPGAPVQLMRLTLFLVVDSAAGMSAVLAHHSFPELGAKRNSRGLSCICGCDPVTPRYRRRSTQQPGSLAKVRRQPPRLIAHQPIWSLSGDTAICRNWARGGSARLALETTVMTVRPEGANYQ